MKVEFKPIVVKDEIILYDIYIDDVWHGSRRTLEQCEDYVKGLK